MAIVRVLLLELSNEGFHLRYGGKPPLRRKGKADRNCLRPIVIPNDVRTLLEKM